MQTKPRALIVEDDHNALDALAELVRDDGFEVACASNLAAARSALAAQVPDILLVDIFLPDGRGTDLIGEIDDGQAVQCVVITGHASVDSAVETLRLGAVDYLTKPIDVRRLRTVLTNVRRSWSMQGEIYRLRTDLRQMGRFGGLVGGSDVMQRLYDTISKVAPTDVSVLLIGESGTGKDVVAETIHQFSRRRDAPFLPVNCGALAPNLVESELFGHERGSFTGADRLHRGFFERASGGTLLLDEIGSTPPEFQVKLLRVLETSRMRRVGGEQTIPIDVRVLAATNRDPEAQIANGQLREDLYYRLKVFVVHLPPLRERGSDVGLLAEHFLRELNRSHGLEKEIHADARAALGAYAWPGNVRELKNVIAHAFVLAGEQITLRDLPQDLVAAPGGPPRFAGAASTSELPAAHGSESTIEVAVGSTIEAAERALILATLKKLDGNKERTAATLGVSLKTLYNRLNRYGRKG